MKNKETSDISFNDWVQERKKSKKNSIFAFVTLLVISISLILINEKINIISGILLFLCFCSFLLIRESSKQSELDYHNDLKEKKKQIAIEIETKRKEQQRINKEKSLQEKREKQKEIDLESKFRAVEMVNDNLNELSKIEIPNNSEFKKSIIENEHSIITKGGDSVLQSFIKINAFLNDIVDKLKIDQKDIGLDFNLATIKKRIIEDAKRNDLDKIAENLADMTAKLEGKQGTGFNSKLELLINLGAKIVPSFQKEIENLQFYQFMGLAMISFYINDKKIHYFEIHEAFEKLGVFDSSWQKNVLSELNSIGKRLANIENQITLLNKEFKTLNQNSESILLELKQIENGINANNVLTAITAYQTWRMNKKLS